MGGGGGSTTQIGMCSVCTVLAHVHAHHMSTEMDLRTTLYLLALEPCPKARTVHNVLEDGSKWGDPYAATHQNGNVELVPVLVPLPKRAVHPQFGQGEGVGDGVAVELPEVVGPGSDGPHVHAQVLLVRGGADGEGMVLVWVQLGARDAHPLPGLVLEGGGPLHEDSRDAGGEELGTHHAHLRLVPADADDLVDGVEDGWAEKEVAEDGVLHEAPGAVEEHEHVEEDVPVVGQPEGLEGVATGVLGGEDEDGDGDEGEDEGAEPGRGEEQPVEEGGEVVAREVDLAEDAAQVVCSLGGDVVEVDAMADDVREREDEPRECHDLVEGNVGVEGDVVV